MKLDYAELDTSYKMFCAYEENYEKILKVCREIDSMANSEMSFEEITAEYNTIENQNKQMIQKNPELYNDEKHGKMFTKKEKINLSQSLRG